MIKVGDRVKFLNDVGGGIVKSFINKNTVNVEGEDGFEIPYPISQLVNVNDPLLNSGSRNEVPKQNEPLTDEAPVYLKPKGEIINGKDDPNFYFCVVPANSENPIFANMDLYLLNDSNYDILFTYSYLFPDRVKAAKQGSVSSNSRVKIDVLTKETLNDLPDFGFQLIYFRETEKKWNEPITKVFKINPVKFYKQSTFQSNAYFKSDALILQISSNPIQVELDKLTHEDFKKVVKEKLENVETPIKIRKEQVDELVFDLHISELLDNPGGLSNREMLEIQLEKVESEMNLAIKSHVKRVVFIHGVGQGVLKQEIANLLNRKFKKYYFQDASFKEYGYGATMVILRR